VRQRQTLTHRLEAAAATTVSERRVLCVVVDEVVVRRLCRRDVTAVHHTTPHAAQSTSHCINFDRRALTVAGPTVWNSLPDYLRDPSLSEDTFRRLYKSSAVAEMGDRGQNRHKPKRGGLLCPFRGREPGPRLTQCGLGRGILPYQVATSSIQPFGHNGHGPKTGGCAPLGEGNWVPRPTSAPSGILMHPAVWPQ